MTNLIERSAAAYSCPLLIKHLLDSALLRAPEQEIVYRSQARFSYRDFRDRVGRLASGLTKLGVQSGNTVGVMDLDSHRYLECFFAVPMMGATLHTINVRLPTEQILYTINHANDDVILVNGEFLPILEKVWDRVEGVKALVLLDDGGERPKTALSLAADYETLLAGADPDFVFPDLDEDTRATTFYTTGTTGLPKGVYFSHRQLVLHTMALRNAITGSGHGRLNDGARPQAGLPRKIFAGPGARSDRPREGHVLPLRPDHPANDPRPSESGGGNARRLEGHRRRRGVAAGLGQGGDAARHRHHHRIWHVRNLSRAHLGSPSIRMRKVGRGPSGGSAHQGRTPDSIGRYPGRRYRDAGCAGGRHDAGRDRGAGAVADAGLSARPRQLGKAVARRMAAHRRHRRDRPRRLPQDHGSSQGRHQDRRRMGLVARHRGPHPQASRRVRSRRHRHSGSEVDRAPARDRGAQGGLFGQRLRDQAGPARLRAQGRDLALRGAGSDRVRVGAAQDQRRQARQESAARAIPRPCPAAERKRGQRRDAHLVGRKANPIRVRWICVRWPPWHIRPSISRTVDRSWGASSAFPNGSRSTRGASTNSRRARAITSGFTSTLNARAAKVPTAVPSPTAFSHCRCWHPRRSMSSSGPRVSSRRSTTASSACASSRRSRPARGCAIGAVCCRWKKGAPNACCCAQRTRSRSRLKKSRPCSPWPW